MITIAARDVNDWIPLEYDPTLQTEKDNVAAIERVARRFSMGAQAVEIPRLLGGQVGGGKVLEEDTADTSKVTMYAYLYTGKQTFDEANAEDSYVEVFNNFGKQWLKNFAVTLDNACIGVTGALSTVETNYRPYNSIIKTLQTTDADAGYTAGDNVISGAFTYDNISDIFSKLESGSYYDQGSVVLAHPGLKGQLRKIKGSDGHPIFQEANANVLDDSVFNHRIIWTRGAVETATFRTAMTPGSSAAKLFVVVNPDALVLGDRIAPQARFIHADQNTTVLEHTIQYRTRKGFVLTLPGAAAALRVTS